MIAQQLVVVGEDEFPTIAIRVKLNESVTRAAELVSDRGHGLDSGQSASHPVGGLPDVGRQDRLSQQLADVV
jgi:hypothetical protein